MFSNKSSIVKTSILQTISDNDRKWNERIQKVTDMNDDKWKRRLDRMNEIHCEHMEMINSETKLLIKNLNEKNEDTIKKMNNSHLEIIAALQEISENRLRCIIKDLKSSE